MRFSAPEGCMTPPFEVSGNPDGHLVILAGGTPSCRVQPWFPLGRLYLQGLQLATYDRPGYGLRQRQEGRTIVDGADDFAAIADKLGAKTFSVIGRSGGGPYALAAAAKYPERVEQVDVLAGMAPPELQFPGSHHNMAKLNQDTYQRRKAAAYGGVIALAKEASIDPELLLKRLEVDFHYSDREYFEENFYSRQRIIASYREALRRGIWGWVDDAIAVTQPWGFRLSEVTAPVSLWYAEEDRFTNKVQGMLLRNHLPNVVSYIQEPDQSHFGAIQACERVLTRISTEIHETASVPC